MNQNPYSAPNSDSTGSRVVLGCTIAGAIGIGLVGLALAFLLFAFDEAVQPPVAPVPNVQAVPVDEAAPPRRPDPQEIVIPEPPPSLVPERPSDQD